MNFRVTTVVAFLFAVSLASQCQAQFQFNPVCAIGAFQKAVQHQCSTPDRPWVCRVEKLGVGALHYRECNGGSFGFVSRIRSRRLMRRMDSGNGAIRASVNTQVLGY